MQGLNIIRDQEGKLDQGKLDQGKLDRGIREITV